MLSVAVLPGRGTIMYTRRLLYSQLIVHVERTALSTNHVVSYHSLSNRTVSCRMTGRNDRVLRSFSSWKLHHGQVNEIPGSRILSGHSAVKDLSVKSRTGRSSYSTIIHSPYPDIDIPENISLPHFMLSEFQKYGNTTALIDGETGKEYSYVQLHSTVLKAACGLVEMGVRKGDVVTFYAFNSPEYFILYLAVGYIGAISSTASPAYTHGELGRDMNQVGASVLAISPSLLSTAQQAVKHCPGIKNVVVFGSADGCRPFSSLLETGMTSLLDAADNVDVDPKNDVFAIPFSSGTTGLPKGVMLTHYSLLSNVLQSRAVHTMDYKAHHDRILSILPIYHIYGQVVVFLAGLSAGATVVTLPKFEPLLYLSTLQKYKATYLPIVPPLVLFLAKHPLVDKFDLSTVENLFTGAAPCGADTIREVTERMNKNVSLRQGYGLTESGTLTHCNTRETNKHHSCGPSIQNTKYKIVDVDSGKSVGAGEKGEVLLRGPQLMKGYFKNEKATAETIVDGWLHTGDVGYYDEDQHLIVVDRIKELIKVKGMQVAPAELEALLVTHPAVLDAAVIGRPDDRLGEVPVAFVVLRDNFKPTEETAKQLQQFVAEYVAPFKRLVGGIEFRQEIPKAPSGKILRRILRQQLQ